MKTKHDNGCWQTLSPSSSFYLDVDYGLARQNDFFLFSRIIYFANILGEICDGY